MSDATAWLEDVDEQLERHIRIGDATKDRTHIHINRCRTVEVSVRFGGRTNTGYLLPATTIRATLRWGVAHNSFDLPSSERPRNELGVCDIGTIADRNDDIGRAIGMAGNRWRIYPVRRRRCERRS